MGIVNVVDFKIYMSRIKRKRAFEHAQNVRIHIILRLRKVSSGHLLSIVTLSCIQEFCWRTVKALIRLRGCQKTRFRTAPAQMTSNWNGHSHEARLFRGTETKTDVANSLTRHKGTIAITDIR